MEAQSVIKFKEYINKSVKLTYTSDINQTNIIHGVINAVTKDYVSLIDFSKREHIIKRSRVKELIGVKHKKKVKK